MDPINRVDDGGSSWSDLWWRQETVQEDDDVLSDDEPHGSPFGGRERKRRRHCSPSNDAAVDDTTKQITLPPEVWADVMRFLPFDMILTCGAVSRSMLNETMPLITKLRIDKSAQMNLAVASRFRDVTDIHINCLLYTTVDEEFTDVEVREESKIRTIPFLSRFARTLERVYFGAKTEAGEDIKGFAPAAESFWQGEESYPDEGARESLMIFIDMLSGAFICGALPAHLKISGLCCPDTQERRSFRAQCAICERACKSFPLESVIEFECLGSSIASARYGRPYGLDVCLQKAEVESIIESRPGGKELLRSDKRLLTLLGSGWRYEIKSDDGDGALVIVKYKKSQLDEMKRVIQYAELDVKKLSMAKLQEAVSKSFIKGSSCPSKSQCYLSEESLASLRGKLGVCIDTEMVGGSVSDLLRYVKPICKVLAQYYDEEAPHNELVFEEAQFEYKAVIYDCFKLIRRVLELQKDAPIQDIVDAKGIPCLISGLKSLELFEVNLEAATSLKLILTNGKEEHRKIIIDAGVIAKFCCLLKPFHLTPDNANVSKMAVLSLVNILSNEKKEHMDAIVQAGGIRKLIGLLASHDDVLVDSALHLLSIAANDRVQKLLRDGGLDFLFGIILSPEDHLDHLQKCATLLCKVFDFDDGFEPIQRAIDAKLISKLVETLRTSENEIVKTNLALVCFKVASVKNEYLLLRLLGVTNFLSTLVGLQDSSIESVSDKAITCLEQIVSIESCFGIESEEPLAWGEYRVLELVDSDEESSVSCEEALEVSDEQVELEEKQAKDANVQRELTGSWVEDDDVDETESPSLLGLPVHLLGAILIYATETEIEVKRLATVCKRVNEIVKYADGGYLWGKFWTLHPTFEWQQRRASLREIRKLQKSTQNEIMAAICGDINVDGQQAMIDADELRTFTTNLLSRLNCLGPVASFRLRGDTIGHLFELCQCYMIERLEQASFLAINSYRTEVQRHDFNVLPSQEMRQGAMWEDRAPGFPSSSGITWIWPDDDCCDVLPKGTVRRIIRRLASKAGIVRMSSSAFDHAEAELLRTIAVLLVEAYESSVQMSKSARFLHNTETLPYGMFPNSMDMFYVPPPPFYGPNDEELYACKSDNFMSEQLVYTIVPGQISAAAARRNIRPGPTSINAFAPIRVYGELIASLGNSPSEEMKIEKGNYYEFCDSDSSSYYGSDEDDSSDDSA